MKTTGIVLVAALAANAGSCAAANHGDLAANQLARQRRQLIHLILGPTVFNRDTLALAIAGSLQGLPKCAQIVCTDVRQCGAEKSDHRHRWLLPPRRERPCRRRSAK